MTMPDSNPSGLGAFTYNIRFPGQYFDKETNLHYNGERYYDSQIGRYISSDRLGLAGGSLSTYTYADNDPLTKIDPTGDIAIAIPAIPVIIEAVSYVGSAAATAYAAHKITQQCEDNKCPPCKTVSGKIVPVGTVAYRPLDVIPDNVMQHGVYGSHHNIFVAKQYPVPKCDCFWAKQKWVAKPNEIQPTWIPIEPFAK
jgi:RHS repeat-associated protein